MVDERREGGLRQRLRNKISIMCPCVFVCLFVCMCVCVVIQLLEHLGTNSDLIFKRKVKYLLIIK